MKLSKIVLAAFVAGCASVSAQAVTLCAYDASAAFDAATNNDANFTFGSYFNSTFTAFPTGGTCLFTGTVCLTSGNYLGAYKSGGGDLETGTGNFAAGELVLHPGQAGEVSLVQFTATTTGTYTIKLHAFQADDDPKSQTINRLAGSSLSKLATLTTDDSKFDYTERLFLTVGDKIGFGAGNDGDYSNDATGFSLFVTRVPEPGTWALMIGGLALTGAAMRRRRGKVVAA